MPFDETATVQQTKYGRHAAPFGCCAVQSGNQSVAEELLLGCRTRLGVWVSGFLGALVHRSASVAGVSARFIYGRGRVPVSNLWFFQGVVRL